jgi:hypothetical protein
MHYRLNPALPKWALATIEALVEPAERQLALVTRRAC